jgi:hypothetical protein
VFPAHFRDVHVVTERLSSLIQLSKCSAGIQQNLPDFVAALVYQSDHIFSVRKADDPIFKNPLFRREREGAQCLAEQLKHHVVVCKGRCSCCNRMPTGIPNTVLVLYNQEQLESRISVIERQQTTIIDNQEEILTLLRKKRHVPIQLNEKWWDTLVSNFSGIVETKISDVLRYYHNCYFLNIFVISL